MGQKDGRIALFQNASVRRGMKITVAELSAVAANIEVKRFLKRAELVVNTICLKVCTEILQHCYDT